MKATIQKRAFSLLLALTLILGLLPVSALAAEDNTGGDTPVVSAEPEGDSNNYEFEDVHGIDEDTVVISPHSRAYQRPARCGHAGGDGRGRAGRGLCGGLRHL